MMGMAFTPAALRIIREQARDGASAAACAARLGWDMARLGRVCREHGIRFEHIGTPRVPAPASAPAQTAPTREVDASPVSWDAATGTLSGRGHVVSFTSKQSAVFGLIWPTLASGAVLPGAQLRGLIAGDPQACVPALRNKLRPFGLAIISSTSRIAGGYRLVDQRASSPVPAREAAE